jgi:hypothetical protein
LNLRRDDQEVDLLIWESGEAELAVGKVEEGISQVHFDDANDRTGLAEILSKLTNFIVLGRIE